MKKNLFICAAMLSVLGSGAANAAYHLSLSTDQQGQEKVFETASSVLPLVQRYEGAGQSTCKNLYIALHTDSPNDLLKLRVTVAGNYQLVGVSNIIDLSKPLLGQKLAIQSAPGCQYPNVTIKVEQDLLK